MRRGERRRDKEGTRGREECRRRGGGVEEECWRGVVSRGRDGEGSEERRKGERGEREKRGG